MNSIGRSILIELKSRDVKFTTIFRRQWCKSLGWFGLTAHNNTKRICH